MESTVSSKNKVQLSLDSIKKIAEGMPGGFFIYRADEKEEILYRNDIVLEIFGCEDEDAFFALTGNSFRGMVHPEDLDSVEQSITEQVTSNVGKFDHVEYRIIRKDGEICWVDDFGRLLDTEEYGNVYYVFIQDVTKRRKIQMENLRMEMELERERKLAETKDDFLFYISHDIRTPMNAIMGFTELAIRHIEEPDRLRDSLNKIKDAGHHMVSLIDEFLEMGQIRTNRVELKPEVCNLKEQLTYVFDMMNLQALEKKITLIQDIDIPDCELVMDAPHFRRIMNNLIDNAIKYTSAGGSVTIRAAAGQSSESGYTRYQFQIADTGIGMSEEFMQRIFHSFEREASSTQSGISGAGLGLPIAKNLTDLMGGTLTVESKKGEGSVFTLALPLKSAKEGESRQKPPVSDEMLKAAGSYRILLVEDVEINRLMAEMLLMEAGFLVESVCDGSDAVACVERTPVWHYDLILMDIQMPVMNGYEATRIIRKMGREDTSVIPIVAFSANTREEDKRRSIESGMNNHIAKPFDLAKMVHVINEEIAKRNS